VKIKKKSGEPADFDRGKLETSMQNAGASADVARRISERIRPSEGLSTDDLRKSVVEELLKENAALSGAYMSTKRLRVRSASDLASGVARLHAEHVHGLRSDVNAILLYASKKAEVRLEPSPTADRKEIHLNKVDIDKLGAQDGSRVSVRFPL